MPRLFSALTFLLFLAAPALAETRYASFHDDARNRDIPVKLYLPDADGDATTPRPLVLFSHGLGGSVEAAVYLGEAMSAHGYVFAVVQHPGSDESVWKDLPRRERMAALKKAASSANALDRPRDVSFVLTQLLADKDLNLDPARVGTAGHSFGALTTMMLVGQGGNGRLKDDRIKAAIAMSGRPARSPDDYAAVNVPVLFTRGTDDVSVLDPDLTVADRRYAFDHASGPDKFLVTFDKADHGVFSNHATNPRDADPALETHVHESVAKLATTFFDACLATPAKKLTADELKALVGDKDAVEAK